MTTSPEVVQLFTPVFTPEEFGCLVEEERFPGDESKRSRLK